MFNVAHRSLRLLSKAGVLALVILVAVPVNAADDAIVLWSAGLDRCMDDPRDEGIRRALSMLEARIPELAKEIGEDVPVPVLQLVLDMMREPMSMRAGLFEPEAPIDGPPLYLQIDMPRADKADADGIGRTLADLLQEAGVPGAPAADIPGFMRFDLDGAAGFVGANAADDAWAATFAVNRHDPAALVPPRVGLPDGIAPLLSGHVDIEQLQPLIEMALQQAGHEEPMARAQLEAWGLIGPDVGRVSFAIGHTDDRMLGHLRWTNFARSMRKLNAVPDRMLTASDLRLIPADATMASIAVFNPAVFGTLIEGIAEHMPEEEAGADPMAMIEQFLGIHPERDVVAHLGQRMAWYMSESTGGGLTGAVGLVELSDPEAMQETLRKFSAQANQMGQGMARGYVEIRRMETDAGVVHALVFPGLPVPIEPRLAIVGEYLVVGASPTALEAGIAQLRSDGPGLAANPRFAEVAGDLDGAMQVDFIDVPLLIESGYGLASLATSALANAVRSPHGDPRDPGIVMPSYAALRDGAKASVTVSRIDGDDLVMVSQSDRSWAANFCGALGMLGHVQPAMAALLAGALLPALGKARSNAQRIKSAAQLRQINMAFMIWAAENDDRTPTDLERMIELGYFDWDLLDSPLGPAMDGGADYWLDLSGATMASIERPDRRIAGYDRAMYLQKGETAVLFHDGHVETMDLYEFGLLVEDEVNAGVDFELP